VALGVGGIPGQPGLNMKRAQSYVVKITRQFGFLIWQCRNRSVFGICGNKMPNRCNSGFHCRSYCLLNMFQATLCPSAGAQEYYTVVAACGIWYHGFQVVGLVWS